jgi:hypothetical protein
MKQILVKDDEDEHPTTNTWTGGDDPEVMEERIWVL